MMRELIGRTIATAAILTIAEAVNLGREEGFEDIADQIGGYHGNSICDRKPMPI